MFDFRHRQQSRRTAKSRRSLKTHSQNRRRRTNLTLETLESRSLLAVATLVDHTFRSEQFAISGSFLYDFRSPSDMNFIDRMTNGAFSSTSGQVDWTSPTAGTGFFEGTATGSGHTTIVFSGSTLGCSDYGITETGRLDFTIDAATSNLVVTDANMTSNGYTSWRDLIPGAQTCVKPEPPLSHFFGGNSTLYDGTFATSTQAVTVNYRETTTSPNQSVSVTSPATGKPAAVIQWTDSAATDLLVAGSSYYGDPTVPSGWVTVNQTAPVKPVTTIDPESGGVTVDASVTGKIMNTATPATPVGSIKLFWATSATDTTGAQITVTSNSDPVGLYWNSDQMSARIEQLPTPPANATHLRVTVSGPSGTDANAANSSVFIPLGLFEATGRTLGPVTVGNSLGVSTASVLSTADLANPDIRVFAYNPTSLAGGTVTVTDDLGHFTYSTVGATGLAPLAEGETGSDTIEFLAIKNQTVVDRVTATVTVIGVNDPPVATNDSAATNNHSKLVVTTSSLLSNDSDPDHGDHVRFLSAATTSSNGATVRLLRNAINGTIDGIEYDPTTSAALRALASGAQLVDSVEYTIRDDAGLLDQGQIQITVTGTAPQLTLGSVPNQMIRVNQVIGPLSVGLFDPDGDPTDIVVTGTSSNTGLVANASIVVTGTGTSRTLSITPITDAFGKTSITLNAVGTGKQTSTTFQVLVGSATDLDLDGISDAIEDAAPNSGDMNNDGILDRQQPNVVAALSPLGSEYLVLATNEPHAFEQVATRDGAGDPSPPAGSSLPLGVTHFELVLGSGQAAQASFRTNLTSPAVNRLIQQKTPGTWTSGMFSLDQGATLDSSGRLLITLRDGGTLDSGAAADSRVTLDAGFAHDSKPWRNINPLDIDNDNTVAPIDALIIINELNSPAGSRALPPVPTGSMTIPAFLDPTGDNFVAPDDALSVINFINGVTSGEGEGEFVDAAFLASLGIDSPADAAARTSQSQDAAILAVVDEFPAAAAWVHDANLLAEDLWLALKGRLRRQA